MIINEIDKKLIRLWKETLGNIKILPTTSFMSAGGDKLLFSIFVSKLSFSFNCDCFPIEEDKLYYFNQQSNYLKKLLNNHSDDILVPLSNGPGEMTLILVHPIGGGLFSYAHLLKHLHIEIPILGLQDSAMCGLIYYYNSLEEQACKYIKHFTPHLKSNKIILLGYSYGATLALEIARQLENSAIDVKHLIMIDGWAEVPFDVSFKNNFKRIILRQVNKLHLNAFTKNEEVKEVWLDLLWDRATLLLKYKPKSLTKNATIIASMESLPEYKVSFSATERWNNYFLSTETYLLPGDHETIMNANNSINVSNVVNTVLARVYNK